MNVLIDPAIMLRGVLVFIRALGVFSVAPIFGHARLPPQLKVLFALAISIALQPVVATPSIHLMDNVLTFGIAVVNEVVVGILIGYVVLLSFISIQVAGEAADMQVGFGMASVADPVTGVSVSIIGQFQYTFATFIFFIMNGHHQTLEGLAKSFQLVPIGSDLLKIPITAGLIDLIGVAYITGLRIGAPIMLSVMMMDVVIGFIGRATPRLNLMQSGYTLKMGIGLSVLLFSLPAFILLTKGTFNDIYADILRILTGGG
jgi:flagellar biosynthetic protein FliR